jgi:hypothetical protein
LGKTGTAEQQDLAALASTRGHRRSAIHKSVLEFANRPADESIVDTNVLRIDAARCECLAIAIGAGGPDNEPPAQCCARWWQAGLIGARFLGNPRTCSFAGRPDPAVVGVGDHTLLLSRMEFSQNHLTIRPEPSCGLAKTSTFCGAIPILFRRRSHTKRNVKGLRLTSDEIQRCAQANWRISALDSSRCVAWEQDPFERRLAR